MEGRIVIISDTHLGRPHGAARSADALRPIWQGAAHLVINGDVAEVHHRDHWRQAAEQTLRLQDLCEADGVPLTLLSGNHDPFLSDLRHLHLADGQILVTHGDAMHPAIAPWSPAAARMRDAHEAALASLDPETRDHIESRLAASQHASHVEWTDLEMEASGSSLVGMLLRPWAMVWVLWYWRVFPRLATEFVERHAPEARFVILGHTHHPGIWTMNERTIINTGSYGFPGRPRAVVVEPNTLMVLPIKRRNDRYELSNRPIARYELAPAPDEESSTARRPSAAKNRPGSERSSATAM